MTRVLLITNNERVRRIFQALEAAGVMRLETAATLSSGDQAIASHAPDFIFVQSRISGFSVEIMLRHLKKALPKGAGIALLAGSPDDAAQAKQHAVPSLDLPLEDEALSEAVRELLARTGRRPRKTAASAPVPPADGAGQRTAPAGDGEAGMGAAPAPAAPAGGPEPKKKVVAGWTAGLPRVGAEAAAPKKPAETAAGPETVSTLPVLSEAPPGAEPLPESISESDPVSEPSPALPAETTAERSSGKLSEETVAETPAAGPAEQEAEASGDTTAATAKARLGAFEEMMQQASVKSGLPRPGALVEDRVQLGTPAGVSEAPPGAAGASPGRTEEPLPPEREQDEAVGEASFLQGEPLAEALLRAQKKTRPKWMVPVAIALVPLPVVAYIAANRAASTEPPAGAAGAGQMVQAKANEPAASALVEPAATPAQVAEAAAPAAATEPAASVAVPGATSKAAADSGGEVGKEPQPEATAGIAKLPHFLKGTRYDADYGKSHPGWKRYVGKRAEYKVFQDEELFKAIQVVAHNGGTIPEPLFDRVLREFGGSDSYQVRSSARKGDYILERAVAKGKVALTIYRQEENRKVKAVVVYYR